MSIALFNSGGGDEFYLPTHLAVTTTQMQLHTTCDDCISLVQDAATILSSSRKADLLGTGQPPRPGGALYDKQYQSRLLTNVASSKCHMCALLHAHTPRFCEPVRPDEELLIVVSRARYNPLAVSIGLIGFEQATGQQMHYAGSLRVQEGGI